jgi:hypothetical protein
MYFRKSYPSKEKDSQGYAGFLGINVWFNKIQRLCFAEMLTSSGSLKNPVLLLG